MNIETLISNIPNFSNRLFGIEIEVNGLNRHTACDLLCSYDIDTRSEEYNHTNRRWWKCTTDSSLSGHRYDSACEIVSPPLPFNRESLELVAKVLKILKDSGATVDETCGLHVHVDARDMTQEMPDFSRILFLRYRECEEMIDKLVATNRRTDSNMYSRSMKRYNRSTSFQNLRGDRRNKLNFQSFERHGTVEFRQHEGCVNSVKVVAWVAFCVNFFEQSQTYFRDKGVSEVMNAGRWADI